MKSFFSILIVLSVLNSGLGQVETKSFTLDKVEFRGEFENGTIVNGYDENIKVIRNESQKKYSKDTVIYPKYLNGEKTQDSLRYINNLEVMEYKDGAYYNGFTPSKYYFDVIKDFYEDGKLQMTCYRESGGYTSDAKIHYTDSMSFTILKGDTVYTVKYDPPYSQGLAYLQGNEEHNPIIIKNHRVKKGKLNVSLYDFHEDKEPFDHCLMDVMNDSLMVATCSFDNANFYCKITLEGKTGLKMPDIYPNKTRWMTQLQDCYYNYDTDCIPSDVQYLEKDTDKLLCSTRIESGFFLGGISIAPYNEQFKLINHESGEEIITTPENLVANLEKLY